MPHEERIARLLGLPIRKETKPAAGSRRGSVGTAFGEEEAVVVGAVNDPTFGC